MTLSIFNIILGSIYMVEHKKYPRCYQDDTGIQTKVSIDVTAVDCDHSRVRVLARPCAIFCWWEGFRHTRILVTLRGVGKKC